MKKKLMLCVTAMALTMAMSFTALAGIRMDGIRGQWIQNNVGWWWQNSDGTNPTNEWVWLDGNEDGTAECYYFDGRGYMLSNTTTPDGYKVNANGAWVQNGSIVTKPIKKGTAIIMK